VRHDVICVIVGSLSDLAVDEGDMVRKGQMICQIESMKVMFPQYAPEAGIVHFEVELGELVGEGEIVAWVETD
jgi:biotin carboxyl carrier protein